MAKTDTQNIIDEICDKIVKQSDNFKKHKNKSEFLSNVFELTKAWDKLSKAYVGLYMVKEDLKRFDKK